MTLATVASGKITKDGGKELIYRCTLCGTERNDYPRDGRCTACGSAWRQTGRY